ncbi:MAG: type III PLP-dependent enzyme [Alphaproteobacteria bacterium PRO2]|nr:type III PLP-dependent enzyme [Alphaproteobacteria bacterium PRO2]
MTKLYSMNNSAMRPETEEGYTSVEELILARRPARPLYVLWPEKIAAAAKDFMKAFPGEAMYAVKTNPDENVLRTLYQAGVRSFDAASIEEVRLVRKSAKKARIYFMHPVKSPEAIREAYTVYGVRDFVLDSEDELFKIVRETDLASDLNLYVRIALPRNGKSAIDFSSKFGANPDDAVKLLKSSRPVAQRLGLCFHVGTQTTDPAAYARAVDKAAQVIKKSGVTVDVLDVGGGFPVRYDESVPSVEACVHALKAALVKNRLENMPLLAEPGRALVAEAGSLVVRVELRKDNTLYINDGTYGGLFDAGPLLKTKFPVRAYRADGAFEQPESAFRFAGPTCDALDVMEGPFMLPADIDMGDWIEVGNLGAYSRSLRTNFNGFGGSDALCLYSPGMMPAAKKRAVKNV